MAAAAQLVKVYVESYLMRKLVNHVCEIHSLHLIFINFLVRGFCVACFTGAWRKKPNCCF